MTLSKPHARKGSIYAGHCLSLSLPQDATERGDMGTFKHLWIQKAVASGWPLPLMTFPSMSTSSRFDAVTCTYIRTLFCACHAVLCEVTWPQR